MVYPLVFVAIWAFLFWKCRYGFAEMDEAFYLTIPMRILQGDALFVHEWNLSQLSSFLLTPLVWFYSITHQGTEGILLWFRYAYTFFWGVTALFLAIRLWKKSAIGAGFASLIFLIYAPLGIMALSYNTIGLLLMCCSTVILSTNDDNKRLWYFLSGLCFAGSVLCQPYVIAIYVLAVLLAALLNQNQKIRDFYNGCSPLWILGWFTAGAASLAILFLGFLFSRASLQDIIRSFPGLFMDPEHQNAILSEKLKSFFISFLESCGHFYVFAVASLALILLRAFWRKGRKLWFSLMCLVTIDLLWKVFIEINYINRVMFPLSFMGLYCGIFASSKDEKRVFWLAFIPGVLYSFCCHYGSNQLHYSIFSSLTVSSIPSAVLICQELQNMRDEDGKDEWDALAVCMVGVLLLSQIGIEVKARYDRVYWEDGMSILTDLATEGPQKGIICSEGKWTNYMDLMSDTEKIRESDAESALILSKNVWLTLWINKPVAAYSAWISVDDSYLKESLDYYLVPRLELYYQNCPEKIPDIIFVEDNYDSMLPFCESMGFELEQTEHGHYILTTG